MNFDTDTFQDPRTSNDDDTKPELRALLRGTGKRKPTGSDSTDRDDFVLAMRATVTGVNLVTTDGPGGRFGLTVSAMCSVSADPPMLLVCISRKNPIRSAIEFNRVFCVSAMAAAQDHLAKAFAGAAAPGAAYDFDAGTWERGATDAPRLAHATASFDCHVENIYGAGSHSIFIGRVAAAVSRKATPLLYNNRRYGIPLTCE
jgi:flavin reductase